MAFSFHKVPNVQQLNRHLDVSWSPYPLPLPVWRTWVYPEPLPTGQTPHSHFNAEPRSSYLRSVLVQNPQLVVTGARGGGRRTAGIPTDMLSHSALHHCINPSPPPPFPAEKRVELQLHQCELVVEPRWSQQNHIIRKKQRHWSWAHRTLHQEIHPEIRSVQPWRGSKHQ